MHDELADLVAGYAVSALDPDERSALEAHLETCEACRQQLSELGPIVDGLTASAGDREPPPGLKDRILAAARAERAAAEPPAPVFSPARSAWPRREVSSRPAVLAGAAAVVALLAAVAALAVWVSNVRGDLDTSELRLAISYEGVEMLAQAGQWWRFEGIEPASEATGALAYSDRHAAACLLAFDLPPSEDGIYYAWTHKDGVASRVGNMWPLDGGHWIIIPGDIGQVDEVTITLEDTRGPPRPSGPVVARLDISGE